MMMSRYTWYPLATILLYFVLQLSSMTVSADCHKCWRRGPDCTPTQRPPQYGGPPCSCNGTARLIGCVLKPCQLVETDTLCDCSISSGSIQNRTKCHKYRCHGDPAKCETCTRLPPDCTTESYINTPASGGPDCACANDIVPSGCTLKPCYLSGTKTTPCIAIGPTSAIPIFGTTCLGNFNLTLDVEEGTGTFTTDITTSVITGEAVSVAPLVLSLLCLAIVTNAVL